ncbi:MAG: aminomethyltransferase family protein, partial [Gemmatimonadota bacterium]
YIEKMTVNKCDLDVGRSIYTPLLTPGGGFRSDLTIMRVAEDRFRIVTGVFDGGRDEYWFRKYLPEDGSVIFENKTESICTIGLWGPNARDVASRVVDDDISNDGLPYGWTKDVTIGGVPATMFRISYVGDYGWEIYTPVDSGLQLWDALWTAGRDFDLRPVGIGVYGTTGRIEKGYRLMGAELESEYNPVEAGLARPKVKAAEFIGKEEYLKARSEDPAAIMCTLTMESHTSKDGIDRFPTGGNEPILTPDGERIVDAKGRPSRVTTAGSGPSLGKYLLMAYLPPEHAVEGTDLQVMYMNETYPVQVARVGSTPLFDPDNSRMKG